MGQSSEQYIELCDEWVNMNPITGFRVYDWKDRKMTDPEYELPRTTSIPAKVVKRRVKKKTLLSGLKQNLI
jgi:hypothetical protein